MWIGLITKLPGYRVRPEPLVIDVLLSKRRKNKMRLVKYNLVCPACKHEFQRKFKSESVEKGTTSCIKCRVVFKRIEFYPDSEIAKIKDEKEKFDILHKFPIPMSVIKGDQIPNSLAETIFKARAIEK